MRPTPHSWAVRFGLRHVHNFQVARHSGTVAKVKRQTASGSRPVGVTVFTMAVALSRLFRPAPVTSQPATREQLRRIVPAIEGSSQAIGNLALLGDKALFLSDHGSGFIMYGIEGRSWVALGDPIGAPEERQELAWGFREAAYRGGGRPVFYEVGRENLPLYIDLGLTLLKLGEQGRVRLDSFTLDGKERAKLRQPVRFCEKQGCSFAIVPAAEVGALLPRLRVVSDAWLAAKRTREKGFSLGRFDAEYLSHFPMAIVWRCMKISSIRRPGRKCALSYRAKASSN